MKNRIFEIEFFGTWMVVNQVLSFQDACKTKWEKTIHFVQHEANRSDSQHQFVGQHARPMNCICTGECFVWPWANKGGVHFYKDSKRQQRCDKEEPCRTWLFTVCSPSFIPQSVQRLDSAVTSPRFRSLLPTMSTADILKRYLLMLFHIFFFPSFSSPSKFILISLSLALETFQFSIN